MKCTYCGHRMQEMPAGKFGAYLSCTNWPDCDARVGLHKNGKPKGTPARHHARQWRKAAHLVFDHLWKGSHKPPAMNRSEAYTWLLEETGITHIGECDVRKCHEVIVACFLRASREGDT